MDQKIIKEKNDSIIKKLNNITETIEDDILKIKKEIVIKEETINFLKKYYNEISNV